MYEEPLSKSAISSNWGFVVTDFSFVPAKLHPSGEFVFLSNSRQRVNFSLGVLPLHACLQQTGALLPLLPRVDHAVGNEEILPPIHGQRQITWSSRPMRLHPRRRGVVRSALLQ